ncbi:hypothetical protein P7C73_g3227, partial [Tremellales sp. Uapishka_1]
MRTAPDQSTQNSTCPHCRVQLLAPTLFIPNIVVDQIIDRKIRALPDSEMKREMIVDLDEKTEAWKVIQAPFRVKPSPKRNRSALDMLGDMFQHPDRPSSAGHNRRASRHLPELGAPVNPNPNLGGPASHPPLNLADMSLAEIFRLESERQAYTATRARRESENWPRADNRPRLITPLEDIAGIRRARFAQETGAHATGGTVININPGDIATIYGGHGGEGPHVAVARNGDRVNPVQAPAPSRISGERPLPTPPAYRTIRGGTGMTGSRPLPLAGRQARGREESGTRNEPLEVDSD